MHVRIYVCAMCMIVWDWCCCHFAGEFQVKEVSMYMLAIVDIFVRSGQLKRPAKSTKKGPWVGTWEQLSCDRQTHPIQTLLSLKPEVIEWGKQWDTWPLQILVADPPRSVYVKVRQWRFKLHGPANSSAGSMHCTMHWLVTIACRVYVVHELACYCSRSYLFHLLLLIFLFFLVTLCNHGRIHRISQKPDFRVSLHWCIHPHTWNIIRIIPGILSIQ